jgi:hypothetical protein
MRSRLFIVIILPFLKRRSGRFFGGQISSRRGACQQEINRYGKKLHRRQRPAACRWRQASLPRAFSLILTG